jgi:hypothetical protein
VIHLSVIPRAPDALLAPIYLDSVDVIDSKHLASISALFLRRHQARSPFLRRTSIRRMNMQKHDYEEFGPNYHFSLIDRLYLDSLLIKRRSIRL